MNGWALDFLDKKRVFRKGPLKKLIVYHEPSIKTLFLLPLSLTRRIISHALIHAQVSCPVSLSLSLVSEQTIKSLNSEFRKKDQPTNILSFQDESFQQRGMRRHKTQNLGELIICPSILDREAQISNRRFCDHWAHLMIHGILHLLNYDHEEESSRLLMERLEIKILQLCGISNPYDE